MNEPRTFTAFGGANLIVSGSLETMLRRTKEYLDRPDAGEVLIFDDQTGAQVDFDFRGTPEQVLARIPQHPLFAGAEAPGATRGGPGRPRLGVVSREVSLLPRHWEWLEEQPNGISAALRRLVDEARRREPDRERARRAREAANRFMTAMAGNLPGFEEATRALFAGDEAGLKKLIRGWPRDIRRHVARLVADAARLEAGEATREA